MNSLDSKCQWRAFESNQFHSGYNEFISETNQFMFESNQLDSESN